MADVKAFKGYRFDLDRVGSYDDVVTPPFDVISPEQRDALAAKSPYNTAHVILPKADPPEDRYNEAARIFNGWIDEGVLTRDTEDSYYLLRQRFQDTNGTKHSRRAFFASVRIPEEGDDPVLGHERTFPHKIKDRLALMQTTESNMGGIFVMYFDREHRLENFLGQMDQRPAGLSARTIDGVEVELWRVAADPAVAEFFAGQVLYIADGHHRFATATVYRDEMRAKEKPDGPRPYDYIMLGLVNFDDPGLLVYPAHRVLNTPEGYSQETFLAALEPYFDIEEADAGGLEEAVKVSEGCVFGLAAQGGKAWRLELKDIDRKEFLGSGDSGAWSSLDVSVLHAGILERCMGLDPNAELLYEPNTEAALRAVSEGEKDLAFILKGATPDQIKDCADAGEFMPQKATYLFPKLPTGAVFHRLK